MNCKTKTGFVDNINEYAAMMLDNFRLFDIDDPKLNSYKTNGSAGWCGSLTKYVVYLSIIIIGIWIVT